MLSKEASSTIFCVFGMTQPGIEPRSPGPLANNLTAWPMSGYWMKKKIPGAVDFFSLHENLHIFVSNPVVHEKYLRMQREMFSNEQIRELQHLSDTRWWCRATSCETALLRLEAIVRFFEETTANEKGARALSPRGLLMQIDAEFVHVCFFFPDILAKLN